MKSLSGTQKSFTGYECCLNHLTSYREVVRWEHNDHRALVFCNHLPKVSVRTLVEAINSDKLRFEVAHLKTVKIVNFYCNHSLMTIYLSII